MGEYYSTLKAVTNILFVLTAGKLKYPGADPGFEKRGGAVASEARSQDFFGQLRGLFKAFGAKRGERAPPAPPPSGSAPGIPLAIASAMGLNTGIAQE